MKTLVIVAHPQLADSTTQAFLQEGARLAQATWRTVETVQLADVQAADRVLFQFPLIWYQAPASLTAWLADQDLALLAHKEFGVVVNLGRPLKDYQAGGRVGVSVDALLSPFVALAHTQQMQYLPPFVIAQFAYLDEQARGQMLVAYQQYLSLPQPQHFSDEAAWWLQQLPAGPLKDALQARQDQLVSLQQALEDDNE